MESRCLRQDSKKYGSILKKIELEEQQGISIRPSQFPDSAL